MHRRLALAMTGLALMAGGGSAQGVRHARGTGRAAQTAPPHAVLLELFTSEGCSSCPPADYLLHVLNNKRTGAGDLIVGISEHVTYWNRLGWRDPFSSEIVTARQRGYAERFHQDDIYTPQMIVNGEAQVLGSDEDAVRSALAQAHPASETALHIASAQRDADGLSVTFSLSAAVAGAELVDVYAVVAEDVAATRVLRGENAGHTLVHVAVATTFSQVATLTETAATTVHIALAKPPDGDGKRHLIVFAQVRGLGPVVAIDSIAL